MSTAIHESFPAPAAPHGIWSGVIADTPAALDQMVRVILPAFEEHLTWGPCRWSPRLRSAQVDVAEGTEGAHVVTVAELVMPVRGNPCLVVFDELQRAWVTEWWPF